MKALALKLQLEVPGDVVLVVHPDLEQPADAQQGNDQEQREQHEEADSQARGQ
jgi:hypothetical protein